MALQRGEERGGLFQSGELPPSTCTFSPAGRRKNLHPHLNPPPSRGRI